MNGWKNFKIDKWNDDDTPPLDPEIIENDVLILIRFHRNRIEIEYICAVFESYNLTPIENVERYRSITNFQPEPTAPPQSPQRSPVRRTPIRRSPRQSTEFRTPNQSPSRPEKETSRPEKSPSRPVKKTSRPEKSPSRPVKKTSRPENSPSRPVKKTSRPENSPRNHEKKKPTKTHEKKKYPKNPTKNGKPRKNIAQYKHGEYGADSHLTIMGHTIKKIEDQNYQTSNRLLTPELLEWHQNMANTQWQIVKLISEKPSDYGYCQMNSEFFEKNSCAKKYFSHLEDHVRPLVLYRWLEEKKTWVQTGN